MPQGGDPADEAEHARDVETSNAVENTVESGSTEAGVSAVDAAVQEALNARRGRQRRLAPAPEPQQAEPGYLVPQCSSREMDHIGIY